MIAVGGRLGVALLAFVAAALFPHLLAAQSTQGPAPSTVEFDDFRMWKEGTEYVYLFTGRPKLRHLELDLKADIIVAWSGKPFTESGGKTGEFAFDSMYAEGSVVFQKKSAKLSMEAMYYDFKNEKGYSVNVVSRGWDKEKGLPVVIRAKEAREITGGVIVMKDATVSTCNFAARHYTFSISELELKFDKDEKGNYQSNYHASAAHATYVLEGIPIFYIPYFSFNSTDDPLIRSLKVGKSNRFGYFVLSEFGTNLHQGDLDSLNPWDDGVADGDNKKVGAVIFQLDYREQRGWAYGLDTKYKWRKSNGFVDTYYLKDRGPDEGNDFDRRFLPLEHSDRGRAGLFHREEITPNLRGELEVTYISDRNLLPEFFEQEYKEEKEKESAVYLRWKKDNQMAYILGRYRLNGFQTQNEYLPALEYAVHQEPFFPNSVNGFYFSSITSLEDIRKMYDQDLDVRSRRMWRLDSSNDITMPYDMGYVQFVPFVGGRLTFFEEDLAEESLTRVIGSAGLRASTNIHRRYPFHSEFLGMEGLRHIVDIEARYANNYYANVTPEEIYQYDNVDAVGEMEEIALEFRNRFQTHVRGLTGKMESYEFMEIALGMEYYPRSGRDTTHFRPQNFLPPFDWMTVAPEQLTDFPRRAHSNLYWEYTVKPKNYLSLAAYGEYNTREEKEENREVIVAVSPVRTVTLGVDQRFVSKYSRGTVYSVEWAASETWYVKAATVYDYHLREYIGRGLSVSREFHDFVIAIGMTDDRTRDERLILVSITPKFLGKSLGGIPQKMSQGGE